MNLDRKIDGVVIAFANLVFGTADGRATRHSDIMSTAYSTCQKMRTNDTVTASISVAAPHTMTALTMYFTVWRKTLTRRNA